MLPQLGGPAASAPLGARTDDGWRAVVEAVAGALPDRVRDEALRAPLRDFLSRPGKRLRGTLVRLAHALGRGTRPFDPNVAAVVELLHAGSLIVDDIEDDALVRREAPALHRLWGTPRALNAANWLYFAALRLIDDWRVPPAVRARAQRRALRTLLRCHEGQSLDLTVRVTELAREEVPGVVLAATAGKSAALLELACWAGAFTAGAAPAHVRALARFGRRLGVALQMYDDLSGFVQESRRAKCHEDLRGARPTWAWAALAARLEPSAFAALQARGQAVLRGAPPEPLAVAMAAALDQRARTRPARAVARALGDLGRALTPSPELAALHAEIARWERSYA